MATRSVSWRRMCPEQVANGIEEAVHITLYLLHQTGPTGFILKEERSKKKVKVFLGDPHVCSCLTFKRTKELCVHLLWIMLKKFHIPRTNPVVWQLGLVQREIDEIVQDHLRRQSPSLAEPPAPPHAHTQKSRIPRKEILSGDVCPICQDDLLKSVKRLTYCRFGCGKSLHVKCMRIWSDHRKSVGEMKVCCPLCREDFGPIIHLVPASRTPPGGKEKPHQHLGTSCSHCRVCPVAGQCYKCSTCASYYLCHHCFSTNQVHLLHAFLVRQHCSQPWRPAAHPSRQALSSDFSSNNPSSIQRDSSVYNNPALPHYASAFVEALQSRSLTEADYEMLLSLDRQALPGATPNPISHATPTYTGHPRSMRSRVEPHADRVGHANRNLRVEPLDSSHPLLMGRACCGMCHKPYMRGDWVKTLLCKHEFHCGCVSEWLATSHNSCPLDDTPIIKPRPSHDDTHSKGSSLLCRRRPRGLGIVMPLTMATVEAAGEAAQDQREAMFFISGVGLWTKNGQGPSNTNGHASNHTHQLPQPYNIIDSLSPSRLNTHVSLAVESASNHTQNHSLPPMLIVKRGKPQQALSHKEGENNMVAHAKVKRSQKRTSNRAVGAKGERGGRHVTMRGGCVTVGDRQPRTLAMESPTELELPLDMSLHGSNLKFHTT